MKTTTAPSYKRHRYPSEIIAHSVGLSFKFSLSFRDIEELMAARDIVLCYETVRR
jgi:putative transposase